MKKIIFPLLVPLVLIFINASETMAYEREIKTLSSALSENLTKGTIKTIAIVDFTDLQGNITELGRFLAEELSGDLASSGRGFEVVDRAHLKTILAEHKLSVSGLLDPNTVKKLGQIAGVGGIVTGSVTPFGESVRLSCKIIATDTAKVIGASKVDIPKTKAIEELLGRGIQGESAQASSSTQTSIGKPQDTVEKTTGEKKTFEAGNCIFELKGCGTFGDLINCSVIVTNMGEEQKIDLNLGHDRQARVVDESGNEHRAYQMTLGNQAVYSFRPPVISQNVPVMLMISFKGISSNVTRIVLLDIPFRMSKYTFKAEFRDIPLTKGGGTSSPAKKGRR